MQYSGHRNQMSASALTRETAIALPGGQRSHATEYEGESIFGGTGPRMAGFGWSVFPQERRGRRAPSRIDGETLKWQPYTVDRPDEVTVRRWAVQAPKANVALITGPASGGIWALDVDVTDERLALKILDIARQVLGETSFRRVGNYPKIAILYRAPETAVIRSRTYRIHDADGAPTEHAVEILAAGKPLTVYGIHHKTGRFFKWGDRQPADETPDAVPLADGARIGAFLEALEAVGISLGNRTSGPPAHAGAFETATAIRDGVLVRPPPPRALAGVTYGEHGRVTDGREGWLFARCRDWATYNANVDHALVVQAAYAEAISIVALSGKWNANSVRSTLTEKIRRIQRDIAAGKLRPAHLLDESGKIAQRALDQGQGAAATTLLKPAAKRRGVKALSRTAPDPIEAARRALTLDAARRDREGERVRDGVQGAINLWFGNARKGEGAGHAIHLLRAPTGAGKTSTLINLIAEAKARGKSFGGPLIVMMPSHANLEEGEARAKSLGGFDAFDRAAAEASRLAGGLNLKTIIYKGAIRGGCKLSEHKRLLGGAQIASGNLCKTVTKDRDGDTVERRCEFYDVCPVIQQRRLAKDCDIILMPHAFLSLPLPKEITDAAKGLVIDESVWSQLVRTATFPAAALTALRPMPRLTKLEKKAGMDPADLIQDRENAAELALAALKRGECPASALAAHKHGQRWVESAKAVAGRTQEAARSVYPGMPLEAARTLAETPKSAHIWEEARFWRIISERITALKFDAVHQSLVDETGIGYPTKAKGEKDARIQLRGDDIRISWRVEPNMSRLPLLLMDASGSPEIVGKLWAGRPVIDRQIDARLHVRIVAAVDRSWSDRSFKGDAEGTLKGKLAAAKNVTLARDAITSVATAHGAGHVLAGATMSVRTILQTAWAEPDNVDMGHFGAFRGLDFANAHSAAISFGRMELPIQVVDGLVAALSYDDEIPEAPMDETGDGRLADGSPLRPAMGDRTIRHRDGSDWTIRVQEHRGPWAKLVQRQFREEELRQFLGRLRPVYRRGEAPTAYICTNAIPTDWVVDEIVSLEDVARPDAESRRWPEAARRTGVIDADAWSQDATNVLSPEDGRLALAALGDRVRDLSVDVRATVWDHDQPVEVRVPAHVEDVDWTVREHLRRRGLQTDSVQVVRDVARIAPAGRKKADKIDLLVGSRASRRDREVLLRERAAAERGPAPGILREVVVEDGRKESVLADEAITFWGEDVHDVFVRPAAYIMATADRNTRLDRHIYPILPT